MVFPKSYLAIYYRDKNRYNIIGSDQFTKFFCTIYVHITAAATMPYKKKNPDVYCVSSAEHHLPLNPILNQPEARYWSPQDYTNCTSYEINVPKKSAEFKEVLSKFRKSCSTHSVTKIRRIQNPYTLGQFFIKRDEMSMEGTVETRELFHGTTKEAIDGICEDNFDWKRHGVIIKSYSFL